MTEKHEIDLDPEVHADDTVTSVWKRRFILVLLIILVVAVAAPTFGGCSGFFSTKSTAATFEVAGKSHEITEDQLSGFQQHCDLSMRLLGIDRGLPAGDEGTKEALRLLMLDSAAKAEGVHVPDSSIADFLESRPQFQGAGGKFEESKYRAALANFSRGGLTHEFLCDTLRVILRGEMYAQLGAVAFELIPGDQAFEAWKKKSLKLSVEYVASPFEAQKARVDALQPAEEDLDKIAGLPAVKAILAVPPRKTVEVAYMKVEDLTPEQFAAAKEFAEKAELFSDERPLEAEAFVVFHGDREAVFTKDHWGQLQDPEYATKRRTYEEEHAKWEKEAKETRGAEPAEPKDPTASYPADERAQFPLWRDRAEKEVLSQKIVTHLGQRAEREAKSLAEVGAEYARFGVKVVKNPEPLTDTEIVEKFPDPVARDSEFDQVVRVIFKAPAEGAVFKPQYQTQAIPTTKMSDRIHDRGYMVLRLDSCDPARLYTVSERREAVLEFWRKYQVAESAKAAAEEIKKKVEAAGADVAKAVEALHDAAAAAGLKAETLRRFNRTTEAPKPPVAAPGQTLAPEVLAAARRIALRNRVQQDYPVLASLDVGKVRDPVLLDEKAEVAIVVLVTEKHEPTPIEMRDEDLRSERFAAMRQAQQQFNDLFGFDALAKRFDLRRFDDKPKKEEKKPK